jgi:hypothetical protein
VELQAIETCREIEAYLNYADDGRRWRTAQKDIPSAVAIQEHLRPYAESWIKSNFRIKDWPFKKQIENDINSQRISLRQWDPDQRPSVIPGLELPEDKPDTWEQFDLEKPRIEASTLFFAFITSKFWDGLKACERCGRFFINTTGHQNKVFCSRACAKNQTALVSTKERRERQYGERLERVKEAMNEFQLLSEAERKQTDWKRWVQKRTGIDPRFITQAITREKLIVPPGLSK